MPIDRAVLPSPPLPLSPDSPRRLAFLPPSRRRVGRRERERERKKAKRKKALDHPRPIPPPVSSRWSRRGEEREIYRCSGVTLRIARVYYVYTGAAVGEPGLLPRARDVNPVVISRLLGKENATLLLIRLCIGRVILVVSSGDRLRFYLKRRDSARRRDPCSRTKADSDFRVRKYSPES